MSKTSSRVTAIGFFVLTGTALVIAMLIAFGGNSWFRSSATYTMCFNSSVKGLSNGSPVMFRGVNIGQVTNIRLQSPEGVTTTYSSEANNSSTIHFPVLVTVELNPEKLGFPAYSWWAILSGKALTHNRREELEAYPYPGLNHIFHESNSPGVLSSPTDYLEKGTIPSQVIDDIARFILKSGNASIH